jgi:transposase
MLQVETSESERRVLVGYKRLPNLILVQMKAEAIILAAEGADIPLIARVVDRAESTIREWLRQWRERRLASVVTGHASNHNASKLTPAQREEITAVLSQPPSVQGLPEQFWTVPKLKNLLQLRFDVVYESTSSYHFLLQGAGLSFHKPEPFDKRRSPDAVIEARMAEIRTEIAPMLADPDTIVYAADEVRIDQEAEIRRAWYRKGTKTKLLVDRQRQSQSYIGFLNQITGEVVLDRLVWQNGETILESLTRLVEHHPGKRICVVWDNAAWHKTKLIRTELATGRTLQNVHLIAMPPYAPDHNPIEHVWKDAKEKTANFQHDIFEDTRTAFETHIASRRFNYTL